MNEFPCFTEAALLLGHLNLSIEAQAEPSLAGHTPKELFWAAKDQYKTEGSLDEVLTRLIRKRFFVISPWFDDTLVFLAPKGLAFVIAHTEAQE